MIDMKKILIVEDDPVICRELTELLVNAGYEALTLSDFSDTKEDVLRAGADLILLDINIPGQNGELLLREIRKEMDTPVIMVTSRTSEVDEVLSMSYGADDYITKPYSPTILLLRISAIFKRIGQKSSSLFYRELKVNPAKGTLSKEGESGTEAEISLTKNEMIIFQLLLDKQGTIVSRDELMTDLWDNNEFVNDNALTVNISRLRSKLSEFGYPDAIETRKKQGYILL